MISDRIESYLNRINTKTKNHKLMWRPILEYLNYYNDNTNLTTNISLIKDAVYSELHEDKSFFIRNDDTYLVLIDYEHASGRDDSEPKVSVCELWGIFHKNADVYKIPPYIEGGIKELQKSIIEYWEFKKGDYAFASSELFEFLEKFSH